MMKNKKMKAIGAAVLLSGVLLATTTLTGNAAGNAWEQFKQIAAQDHVASKSMTVTGSVSISDNDEQVLHVTGDAKINHESDAMSGSVTVATMEGTQTFNIYVDGEAVLMQPLGSNNWYRAEKKTEMMDESDDESLHQMRGMHGMKTGESNVNPEMQDMLMDTIMGDLKDQVTLTEANGIRTFTLELNQNNMPVLLQSAFSAGISEKQDKPDFDHAIPEALPQELKDIMQNMMDGHQTTEIVSDANLDAVSFSISVDENNQPAGFSILVSFSGKDAEGILHAMVVRADATLTGYNTTTPDKADINGPIVEIDTSAFEDHDGIRRNRMNK